MSPACLFVVLALALEWLLDERVVYVSQRSELVGRCTYAFSFALGALTTRQVGCSPDV